MSAPARPADLERAARVDADLREFAAAWSRLRQPGLHRGGWMRLALETFGPVVLLLIVVAVAL